ncbi:hypothetical protein ACFVDI_20215 [Nocardioides sp. NPDC057767]|uniref:hypothetical protein n=1 Tax=unclassified Nocardioides TaxID=2615069 RepID=UPI00366E8999
MTWKGQRQLIRAARRLSLWTRATFVRHVLIAVVAWLVFAILWVVDDDPGSIGRLDRIGLLVLGAIALLASLMWLIAHRSVIVKQIVAAYPLGQVVFSAVDERGFRIAHALGETSWRWDQLRGARTNAGVLGIPDRLAVRPEQSLPGLMPELSVWVPRAVVADDVLRRIGLSVVGQGPVPSQEGFPRGTGVRQARTWVATADSQRKLARDAWLTLILEPKMLAVQVLLAVAAMGHAVLGVVMILDGSGMRATSLLFPAVVALSVWTPWWMTRRQVRTLFPVGFGATLQLEDVGMRVLTAWDEQVIPWRVLQGSRVRGTAFTYPNPVQSMGRETIPVALVPDDVLSRLGCRPPGTQLGESRGISAGQ